MITAQKPFGWMIKCCHSSLGILLHSSSLEEIISIILLSHVQKWVEGT